MQHSIKQFAVLFSTLFVGCSLSHGRGGLPPIPSAEDGGLPFVADGGAVMVRPDAGPGRRDAGLVSATDSGTIEMADAGSDAFVPPTEDAGFDAGPPPEPDSGPMVDAGSDARSDSGAPSCALVYEVNFRTASQILVDAGYIRWPLLVLRITNPCAEDETVTELQLVLDGDDADVSDVVIGDRFYSPIGMGTFVDAEATVPLTTPVTVPAGAVQYLGVDVHVPSVVTNSTSHGEHEGFPMSGDSFRIGVVNPGDPMAPLFTNEMVLRGTDIQVLWQTVTSSVIANGTLQELFRFGANAGVYGSRMAALNRVGLAIDIETTSGSLCDPVLYCNGVEMPSDEYSFGGVVHPDGLNCWPAGGEVPLTIFFRNEQIVTADRANSYTVFATPMGFVSGDSITTHFDTSDHVTATGYLRSTWAPPLTDEMLDFSPWGAPNSTRTGINVALVWSDLSEVPHSSAFGTDGGSRDWANGYLVPGLVSTRTTLTR